MIQVDLYRMIPTFFFIWIFLLKWNISSIYFSSWQISLNFFFRLYILRVYIRFQKNWNDKIFKLLSKHLIFDDISTEAWKWVRGKLPQLEKVEIKIKKIVCTEFRNMFSTQNFLSTHIRFFWRKVLPLFIWIGFKIFVCLLIICGSYGGIN